MKRFVACPAMAIAGESAIDSEIRPCALASDMLAPAPGPALPGVRPPPARPAGVRPPPARPPGGGFWAPARLAARRSAAAMASASTATFAGAGAGVTN